MVLRNDLGETNLQRLCDLIATDTFLLYINIAFGVNEVYLRSIGGKSTMSPIAAKRLVVIYLDNNKRDNKFVPSRYVRKTKSDLNNHVTFYED